MNFLRTLMLLSVAILIAGCIQASILRDFAFNSKQGICTSKVNSTANVKLIDNKILFSGSIIANNPCNELKASYSIETINFTDSETTVIIVKIEKESTGEVCVECIGEIPFDGEVTIDRQLWNSGKYGVEIIYDVEELASLYSYEV